MLTEDLISKLWLFSTTNTSQHFILLTSSTHITGHEHHSLFLIPCKSQFLYVGISEFCMVELSTFKSGDNNT